jgi:hypothetical protein
MSVCLCIPLIVAKQRLRKNPLIVARQWLGKNPLIVARQRLGKNLLIVAKQRPGRNVTAVTNTHATIEELLEASFSMWPVSYQGKQAISSSQNFLFIYNWSQAHKIIYTTYTIVCDCLPGTIQNLLYTVTAGLDSWNRSVHLTFSISEAIFSVELQMERSGNSSGFNNKLIIRHTQIHMGFSPASFSSRAMLQ